MFQCQAPSLYFLGSLGGWSCDGVTVNGELLARLLEKAKQDSEVKDTFVEMVCLSTDQGKERQRSGDWGIVLNCVTNSFSLKVYSCPNSITLRMAITSS